MKLSRALATASALALTVTLTAGVPAAAIESAAVTITSTSTSPAKPRPTKPLLTARPWYDQHRTTFSPNGDGRQDTAALTMTLRRRAHVVATVRDARKRIIQVADLGRRHRGKSNWAWTATDRRGDRVADGTYRIRLRAVAKLPRKLHRKPRVLRGTAVVRAEARSTFTTARPGEDAPAVFMRRSTIYPDTPYFTDRLRWFPAHIWMQQGDLEPSQGIASIYAADGSLVWRESPGGWPPAHAWDATDQAGHRVPDGDYTLSVSWQDPYGNVATIDNPVVVADGTLVEQHWTTTVNAADAQPPGHPTEKYKLCGPDGGAAYVCFDYCPPTASERFPEGLSIRDDGCYDASGDFSVATPYELDPVTDVVRVGITGGSAIPANPVSAVLDIGRPPWRVTTPTGDATTTIEATREGGASFSDHDPRSVDWTVDVVQEHATYDIESFTVEVYHYAPPAS